MERLEKTVEANGCLLKVERLGKVTSGIARAYLLTFDIGRLLIEVASGRVHSVVVESADEIPAGLEKASEDEPWWRLIGCPLTRVWGGRIGAQGIRLRFREDQQNPKVIALVPDGQDVRVALDE